MKKILTLLCVTGLLSGCASVGRKIDQSAVDRFEKGKTTKQEVLSSIGSPDQMTRAGNGDVTFHYHYARATAKPESYIPIVGMFAGGANMQNQMVMVTFGPDGILKDITSTQGATESGVGASAGSKADVKEVETNKRPK